MPFARFGIHTGPIVESSELRVARSGNMYTFTPTRQGPN